MQKYLTLGIFLCLASAILLASAGGKGGDWKEKMKEKMKKCKDAEINVEEAWKGKEECMAEFKKTDTGADAEKGAEERRRRSADQEGGHKKKGWGMMKNSCFHVCMWKKQGVLDDAGKFNEAGAQEHVNKVYPEAMRTDAFNGMKECNTNHSSTFSMDDKCKSYGKFKWCLMKSHGKVCGIDMKKWKGGRGGKGKGKGKGGDEQAPEEEE